MAQLENMRPAELSFFINLGFSYCPTLSIHCSDYTTSTTIPTAGQTESRRKKLQSELILYCNLTKKLLSANPRIKG